MKCTIYEAYQEMNADGVVYLYTNARGLRQMKEGNAFYVWTKSHASPTDTKIRVMEKDLAVDRKGTLYCVDGLDVIIAN